MELGNRLSDCAREQGIALTGEMEDQFRRYLDLLLEWNGRINLTAITDPEEVAVKHFLDSLLLLKAAELPPGASLIDVGTGAGFPGIPLKIARPDLRITLLDSLAKRLRFLEELSRELGQDNRLVHARAEDAGRDPALREAFDFATARAVAPLPVLCEYCLPFVRPGGMFLAMKGPEGGREMEEAARGATLLGAGIPEAKELSLPPVNGERAVRTVIIFKKESQTPSQYPRKPARIAKSPL